MVWLDAPTAACAAIRYSCALSNGVVIIALVIVCSGNFWIYGVYAFCDPPITLDTAGTRWPMPTATRLYVECMSPDEWRGLSLDRSGERPIYQQLYAQLRAMVLAGAPFGEGGRLPSTRRLAEELGISRNTALLVYQRLREDGLVRTQAGGGTVVDAAPELRREHREIPTPRPGLLSARGQASLSQSNASHGTGSPGPVPRAIGTPGSAATSAFAVGAPPIDLFPAALWAALTSRRLRLSGKHALLGTARAGFRPLREAIAAHLGTTRGLKCGAGQILVTRGIGSGLELIARALLDRGESVWCEEPGHPGIRNTLDWNGLLPCPIPVDDEGLALDTAIATAPDARMAVVSPARQLPMGVIMGARRRRRLLEYADRSGMWVVEHENDGAFLGTAAPPPLLADDPHGRVIYLGTFNTLLFPQLHVGYCVVPEELAEPCAQVLGAIGAAPSALTQTVLADLLDDHRSARILARMRATVARRRETVRAALAQIPELSQAALGAVDSGSSLTLALPAVATEHTLVAAAASASLLIRPLSWYFDGKPATSGVVLGCAAVRDEAIGSSVQTLAALLAAAQA